MPLSLPVAAVSSGALLVSASIDSGTSGGAISGESPFGWLGSILLAALAAFTLHKAGSVKAWKETAEARAERLEDVERELGELRAELKIPERIEGIIALMGEQAIHADAAASRRLDSALGRMGDRFDRLEQMLEPKPLEGETV